MPYYFGPDIYDEPGIEYPPNMGIPSTGIPVNLPTISTTPLPWPKSTNTTTLDKSLAALLSGLAILKGRDTIPTVQQQNQGIDPAVYALIAAQNQQAGYQGSNTGAKIENWFKNNTGVALMGAAFLAFYLLPSPRKNSR